MSPRLRSLTVRGFRAYGAVEQTLNLPSDIAVVWGPNSKGKTSLAEALEFLLTGEIARRRLMASSQDEFADALRNAHLKDGEPTYVAARILAGDGKEHDIKRTLTLDYRKKQDCQSRLEIDGVESDASGLTALGIVLSQPPLQAPVLAQHTLGYLFTAGPQDRATYFKTLLELTDLELFRNEVAALSVERSPTPASLIKLAACADIAPLSPHLAKMRSGVAGFATVMSTLSRAAGSLLESAGQSIPEDLAERISALKRALASSRCKAFPVQMLDRREPGVWAPPTQSEWGRVEAYIRERAATEMKVQQLLSLFEQALRVPHVATAEAELDCPLCDAKSSLTPARITFLRQRVQQAQTFTSAERTARDALSQIRASVRGLLSTVDGAVPQALTTTRGNRREAGFSTARMHELLGGDGGLLVRPWLSSIRPLRRAADRLRSEVERLAALLDTAVSSLADLANLEDLGGACKEVEARNAALLEASLTYQRQVAPLRKSLEAVLDEQAGTKGWQDFIDLASDPEALQRALTEQAAQASVAKELESALRDIDDAKELVLDDKFDEHSSLVRDWWERLRPGEPSFFRTVKPRKGAKRTIDIKVGLSPNEDRSVPKLRDAIAVFSQSQIHCLGLSLFLARAQREECGFIMLDDPVLSSDEDYRVHFHADVLEAILNIPMQVVILTQCHPSWEELESRYRHANISQAQLWIATAAEGTIIELTSDGLRSKIGRARSLARSPHPDNLKSCGGHLRDASERFCKELLVQDRRAQGHAAAELRDYDDETLGPLADKIAPLLIQDPSHRGKFESIRKLLNPKCHDNAPPSSNEMVHACGEIERFVKDYLGR